MHWEIKKGSRNVNFIFLFVVLFPKQNKNALASKKGSENVILIFLFIVLFPKQN